MTYTISTFSKFPDAEGFKNQWDQLVEDTDAGMFMTYEWIQTWWKYYGNSRTLSIHVVSKNGKWVAVLPYFQERFCLGPIRFRIVKLMGSDFMPITIKPAISYTHIEPAVNLSLTRLTRDLNYDLIHLGPLSGDYNDVMSLFSAVKKWSKSERLPRLQKRGVQTYYYFSPDLEGQLAALSKQERKKIRRGYRDLKRLGLEVRSKPATISNRQDLMKDFIRMHQRKWSTEGRAGHFVAWPHSSLFHEEISRKSAENGSLRLLAIKLNDRIIGYKYVYRSGTTYYAFLDAREDIPESKNVNFYKIAYFELVKKGIREGVNKIDSMRGSYQHKLSLGGRQLPTHDIFFHARGVSIFKAYLVRAFAWILNLAYYKIYRSRVAPKLGLGKKSFNTLWMKINGVSF